MIPTKKIEKNVFDKRRSDLLRLIYFLRITIHFVTKDITTLSPFITAVSLIDTDRSEISYIEESIASFRYFFFL